MLEIKIDNDSYKKFGNTVICNDNVYHYIIVKTIDNSENIFRVNDNLVIYFSVKLIYEHNNVEEKGIYNVIRFKPNDENKFTVFEKFRNEVINRVENNDSNNLLLQNLINDWLSVFKFKSNNLESFIGLYGELAFIYFMMKNFNIDVSNAYQVDQYEAVDFAGENYKIDCKTTRSSFIKFTLTRRQIDLLPNIVFIRLYEKSNHGMSIVDLYISLLDMGVILSQDIKLQIENDYCKYKEKYDIDDLNIRLIKSESFNGLSLLGLDSIKAEVTLNFQFEESNTYGVDEIVRLIRGE